MIPIAPALAEQLRRHEEYLRRVYPDGTDWLLPSPPARGAPGMGRGGRFHITPGSVNELLRSYVGKANIRDRDGQLATWVHAHAFRHHLGTSMVNDGVPLPVIQRLFDHASITMTAHYAQLHDETLRREITRWHERVNIRGERIALPLDGPLEEAAWMKERIARAKQALPNGYCGLPLVQTCPHPNAYLSCDNFLTDGSFRTVHEQQLEHTSELRERAQQTGSLRLVEVLERDERSLTRPPRAGRARLARRDDHVRGRRRAGGREPPVPLQPPRPARRHRASTRPAACAGTATGARARKR